jgi:integrase
MASRTETTKHPGVFKVHRRTCAVRGEPCKCPPSFQAVVGTYREGKRVPVRKHFPNITAARDWQRDASTQAKAGTLVTPTKLTLWEAANDLIKGMRDGRIFDRSKRPYKPSTVRAYETHLRTYILPALGHRKLGTITADELQAFLEGLQGEPHKLSGSTIRNVLCPLQVIYHRHRRQVPINPTQSLDIAAKHGRRDVRPSLERTRQLLDALPPEDRPLWACASYSGLRRGELQALRWRHVDFEARKIRVERSWDQMAGEIDVKTAAGRRTVPIADPLRRELAAHKLRTGRGEDDLVFGRTARDPFVPASVRTRSIAAWEAAGLEPVGLHGCRHFAASFFIKAGMNPKELSTYMGHSSIQITFNTYGHLMADGLGQAADRLSAFLDAEQAGG